ncbi:MAG: hypothetical protein JWR38_5247 [Mucilaginibacter sp.]|nr:hypothetical protein [Mucilaginibacter sp.]
MLRDELNALKKLVNDLPLIEPESDTFTAIRTINTLQAIKMACGWVKDGWLKAFFSEAPDHSLRRYFYYHLEGISKIADTLFHAMQSNDLISYDQELLIEIDDQLLTLILHLKKHHKRFFNDEANSPILWRKKILHENEDISTWLINKLEESDLPVEQTATIICYLREMMNADSGGFYTFHSLNYYEGFISALTLAVEDVDLNEAELNRQLTALNFNNLAYVDYRYNQIESQLHSMAIPQEKVLLLLEERNRLKSISVYGNHLCHTRFPSITALLDKWLCEQIIHIEEQNRLEFENESSPAQTKLFLNLSVAQIACLLRVLYEADCFGGTPLTEVIKFVTQNFSSKKQAAISIGGLSKEYYSTTQVTAGKVIVFFQRLIVILKRIFFPLLVVASIIFGV